MTVTTWLDTIISRATSPSETWTTIFTEMKALAMQAQSPMHLQQATVAVDRLLAESAWELWRTYTVDAPRTAVELQRWWSVSAAHGHAVLSVDARSLRELPLLVQAAEKRGFAIENIKVTGAEAPSNTDHFARALGVTASNNLDNNKPPSAFLLQSDELYTDVLNLPFADCTAILPYTRDLFIWHTWLDDQIHLYKRSADQIAKSAAQALQEDSFWELVARLCQGRRMVITADHGYAISKLFSTEIEEPALLEALRTVFGASRSTPAQQPWIQPAMPPLVLSTNGCHIVMGQTRWKVQGGFPELCHGGLSMLEVAVPFVEFSPR